MTETGENEFMADDWATLQRLLYRDSWNEDLGRHRSPYVFRGMTNTDHTLRTSLQRFVGDSNKWDLEVHLLRNFRQYARQEIDQPESPFHLMALGQHHGLPTRLLDWTYSPAVAAYFATGGSPDTDGVVWAVDYEAAHERLPDYFEELLDELGTNMFNATMLYDLMTRVIEQTRENNRQLADRRTLPMLDVRDVLEEFSKQRGEDYIVFFQPPSIDQRIVNQAALFSSMANPRTSMDEWLEDHPELFWKIVIPAERKREFRDKLDQANINHRTLFPGLDGIAMWLKEYYRPSNSQ
ncbi:FRG domain-containing protein [Natrinema gelatinilyticum]|uniref:FRG domain-containing protein n=1 Tax=Natrinema gelatinilyticum TaxID=2961571 RepID=UPI0020C4CA5B|nr:FRG domain-containing protein [Natrinema gelatinilyticum]